MVLNLLRTSKNRRLTNRFPVEIIDKTLSPVSSIKLKTSLTETNFTLASNPIHHVKERSTIHC